MNDLVQSYENKILGIRNYVSDKKQFSTVDFININILAKFLDEVDTGESDITPAGKSFLESYYGFSNLAKHLIDQQLLKESIKDNSVEDLKIWLENLVPMESATFIAKSRGNIKEDRTMYIVRDLCPVCDSGPIGYLTIEENNEIICFCDECESVWQSVEYIEKTPPKDLRDEKILDVHWSTKNEIESKGFDNNIVGFRMVKNRW